LTSSKRKEGRKVFVPSERKNGFPHIERRWRGVCVSLVEQVGKGKQHSPNGKNEGNLRYKTGEKKEVGKMDQKEVQMIFEGE